MGIPAHKSLGIRLHVYIFDKEMAHTTIFYLCVVCFYSEWPVVPCHRMRDCDKTAGIIRRGQNWMSRLLYWTGRDQSVFIFCRLFRNLDTCIYIDGLFFCWSCFGFLAADFFPIQQNTCCCCIHFCYVMLDSALGSRILFDDQLVILASETGMDPVTKIAIEISWFHTRKFWVDKYRRRWLAYLI